MKTFFILILLIPVCAITAPVAIETSRIDRSNQDGRFGLGGTVSVAQRPFLGIDDQQTSLPYLSFAYKDFYIEGVNIGYTLSKQTDYKFDLLVTPRFYESKPAFASGSELQGINVTKPTILGGVSAQYNIDPVTITLQFYRDLLESNGLEAVTSISKGFALSKTFTLTPTLGFTWQNSELIDHFYGVQSNEVLAERPLYKGGASINYNTSLTSSWNVSRNIELLAFVKYEILGDGITNSPIVDEDSILLSAFGAVYRF